MDKDEIEELLQSWCCMAIGAYLVKNQEKIDVATWDKVIDKVSRAALDVAAETIPLHPNEAAAIILDAGAKCSLS